MLPPPLLLLLLYFTVYWLVEAQGSTRWIIRIYQACSPSTSVRVGGMRSIRISRRSV
jgi:hypothetical protein